MSDLTDRVVMVAGAAGNLGQAVAQGFLAAGAKVVLLDRAEGQLEALYPELVDSVAHLLLGGVDAAEADSVEGAVQRAVDRFGRIDVLANTVGGYRAGQPVHETAVENWEFMLTLNARTAFVLSRAVVPVMLGQGGGRIVHVGARAGLAGAGKAAAYSASKAATIRLVESLAAELKQENITVNCVLPATIDTPQNREAMPKADRSRWVAPEAIADVILFLASDAARAVTGAAVPVYGKG
jgi:NAD(P)-dependent dehydrogenase (short-subunit alcohol dehydrogenase family)